MGEFWVTAATSALTDNDLQLMNLPQFAVYGLVFTNSCGLHPRIEQISGCPWPQQAEQISSGRNKLAILFDFPRAQLAQKSVMLFQFGSCCLQIPHWKPQSSWDCQLALCFELKLALQYHLRWCDSWFFIGSVQAACREQRHKRCPTSDNSGKVTKNSEMAVTHNDLHCHKMS